MKIFAKTIESKVKVRFPDCDPFNHLNNSKYIDYIINAREDQLVDNYDFDIHKLAIEKGISWVVGQNQITYLMPAVLMEIVVVESRLIAYDGKSLLMEAFMWNENKTMLKAVLWTKFIHFNLRTKKSEVHSDELMDFFKQVENPLAEKVSFEDRVKNLRTVK